VFHFLKFFDFFNGFIFPHVKKLEKLIGLCFRFLKLSLGLPKPQKPEKIKIFVNLFYFFQKLFIFHHRPFVM